MTPRSHCPRERVSRSAQTPRGERGEGVVENLLVIALVSGVAAGAGGVVVEALRVLVIAYIGHVARHLSSP